MASDERRIHIERDGDARLPVLIDADGDSCHECWSCARLCPARAIRIDKDGPLIIQERCVGCGLCVSEYSCGGFRVRDDTAEVVGLLEGPRPVVAVLATEFIAAMHPLSPLEVERRLEEIGFHAVESTLLGEEMVAKAYEELCARNNGLPLLRSTCPVVVGWVRRFHPSLTGALAPIVPPYIVQARLVKELYTGDVAVVYAGPCFARKDEARDAYFGGVVDVAIDFIELGTLLDSRLAAERPSTTSRGSNRPVPFKEISLTDGFPRTPLEERTMIATDVHVSRGLHDVDRILSAIEAGEAVPDIVDLLSCEGCIDGPAVSPGLTVFAKRNIDIAERENRARNTVGSRELLRYLPEVDIVRSITASPIEMPMATDEEVDVILAEGGFASRDEAIDCGACGYRTCVQFAGAIYAGIASWEMCFPIQRRRLTQDIEDLTTTATIDPLTGLHNRTVLTGRLEDEMSRYRRYGTPVSLLMMDLDSLKAVNDEYGHLVGDQLLSALGHLLAESMRTSDFAVRYGGDEFVIVLPGTSKTEAYAVAEKVRMAVESLKVTPRVAGGDRPVGMTVSIGVAATGSTCEDAMTLLDAADQALYAAKEGGRDQVRLSSQ